MLPKFFARKGAYFSAIENNFIFHRKNKFYHLYKKQYTKMIQLSMPQ